MKCELRYEVPNGVAFRRYSENGKVGLLVLPLTKTEASPICDSFERWEYCLRRLIAAPSVLNPCLACDNRKTAAGEYVGTCLLNPELENFQESSAIREPAIESARD